MTIDRYIHVHVYVQYIQADRSNCPEPHGFSFNTAANSMIKVKMKKNDSYKPEDNDYIVAVG